LWLLNLGRRLTILTERGTPPSNSEGLPGLVRSTIKGLPIVPSQLAAYAQAEKTITVLLNNPGSIGYHLAEFRNQFGTAPRSLDRSRGAGRPARETRDWSSGDPGGLSVRES